MKQRSQKTYLLLGSALLCLWLNASPVLAQQVPARTGIDAAELESFLDRFMGERMAARHVPGAALVLVQDGKILLSKGYGYADVENAIPVDPERTVFRLGSVGKVFTAVAALQLVEQGHIDLHTDVNGYLTGFQLPKSYSQPLTLHHLLTHTAGFDGDSLGYAARNPADLVSLEEYVTGSVPPQVRPPGEVHSYCNYCFDLAGYLVEQVSGLPFARYVEERIFHPLGMDQATFVRPEPPALAANRALGYVYRDGGFHEVPPTYQRSATGPAGSLSAPAAEMASLMIALLQGGKFGEGRILDPATADLMQQQQFSHHPTLPGLGYSFEERLVNGLRIASKGGDDPPYSSELILVPEENLGFFVTYNAGNIAFREDLVRAFFDHYYPAAVNPSLQPLALSRDELQRFEGAYRYTRYNTTDASKLNGLLFTFDVRANEDGTLSLAYPGAGQFGCYAPIEPTVFRRVTGGPVSVLGNEVDVGDSLIFRQDGEGRITYLFVPFMSFAFQKLAWYEGSVLQVALWAAMSLLFLSALIAWPLGWLVRRLRHRDTGSQVCASRARWLAGIISALNLLFLVGSLALILSGLLTYGASPLIIALLVVPIVTSLLTHVLLTATAIAWKDHHWTLAGRIYYTLIALAAVAFVGWANYWNLLGFHL